MILFLKSVNKHSNQTFEVIRHLHNFTINNHQFHLKMKISKANFCESFVPLYTKRCSDFSLKIKFPSSLVKRSKIFENSRRRRQLEETLGGSFIGEDPGATYRSRFFLVLQSRRRIFSESLARTGRSCRRRRLVINDSICILPAR